MQQLTYRLASMAAGLLLTSSLAAPAQAEDFYFGDSDLEQGNFYVLFGLEDDDIDDDFPYFCEGRLCRDSNGPVWAEILTPGVVAALSTDELSGSLNFAVSGGHMTSRGDENLPIPTGVTAQIEVFRNFVSSGAISVSKDDRFFIHAGPNDLERLVAGETPAQVTQAVVGAAVSNVKSLSDLGARTIVISNVQSPAVLPSFQDSDFDPFRQTMPALVSSMNEQLLTQLRTLKTTLPDEANVILVDHDAFARHLVRDFQALGFSNATDPCLDADTGAVCAPGTNGSDTNVFFDGNHYSASAHRLLANWYSATLNAASGAANADAGQIPIALLASSQAVSREGNSAFRMAGYSDRAFSLYGAPIYDNLNSRAGLSLRQRGGVGGIRVGGESGFFGGVSGSYVRQEVTTANAGTFDTKEWGFGATVGYSAGPFEVFVQGSYSRPTVRDFTRQTGALKLAAKGETKAKILGASAGFNTQTAFDRLHLDMSARADYRRVRVDGFDESDADGLELSYDRQRESTISTFADVKMGWELADPDGDFSLQPFVQVQDQRRLSGGNLTVTSRLIDNVANSASLDVANPNFNSTSVGGGVAIGLSTRNSDLRLEAGYQHHIRGAFKNDGRLMVGLSASF